MAQLCHVSSRWHLAVEDAKASAKAAARKQPSSMPPPSNTPPKRARRSA